MGDFFKPCPSRAKAGFKKSPESTANLCREYGMSQATFYKWRSKYGDVDVILLKDLKS
jgi:transposase-like protein